MRIGIPRELKPLEGRVGLIPAACSGLVKDGHTVMVEAGAGIKSGYSDDDYRNVGVEVIEKVEELYEKAEMIVKVKEPIKEDLKHLRKEHLLFCYLHLAAEPDLTAVAFETVEVDGKLPLLAPMSDIAGRLSAQWATTLLHAPNNGRGVLLGGIPAARRGHVVILGAGVSGGAAATIMAGMGAEVTVFDLNMERLEEMRKLGPNVTGLYPHVADVADAVKEADVVIGAVLITGKKAPRVVTRDMVESMQPGSVVVDISVDQGGCIETTKPTTWDNPTYEHQGVTHFTVTHMPGAVPRTSSQALSAAIARYASILASGDWRGNEALVKGINVENGKVVHPALLD